MEKQLITRKAVYQVLGQYWQQYKSHPWWTLISFFLPTFGRTLVFFVPPLIIARLVNIVASGGEISVAVVGPYVALFAGLWFLGELFYRVAIYFITKLEADSTKNLSLGAFKTLANRDYDFYTNNFVGSLTKKAMAFSRGFEQFTDTLIFNVITNIFPFIFAAIVLWRYSPWIPLVLFFFIASAIAIGIPIIRYRSKLVSQRHDAGSKMVGRLSDAVTNIFAIKSFAKEDREEQVYATYVNDWVVKYKKAANYQNIRFEGIMSPIYVLTNAFGLVAAIFFTHTLGLQAGVMVIVFSYYSQISMIFWEFNRVYRNIESAISEASEFTQLFIDPPKVLDASNALQLKVTNANVAFKNINFKYGAEDADLFLNNFNLDIKSNQRVGLVGPSGGGKTTITKLLLRFVNLDSGQIAIDGQDISAVTQASLREAIAYVPQDPLLFHRTLFENIAYGNENATKEEVVRAAQLARADEFIDKLPHGYDTLVGERGIKLSGGQRQRVAIARAILKKSPILVLDEATSSLDSESEKYIQEGLWELMKNKTALVIAHRLSTIKHLDRIIVLDQGKIVQDGTHDELIKKKGIYAKLWSHQTGEFLGE